MSKSRKVALVTGSATGIGRAAAIRFARAGMAVVVNYSRSEVEARETLGEIEKLGVPGLLCKANVADEAAVNAMVEACANELGGLDVLVNNAGTTRFIDHTDLHAATSEIWDEILGVNLKGTFFCCRAALPHLQKSGGSIVNVTSVAGLQGHGSSIPYAASKAAINCMTKSLARAFAPQVRVNAVAPGPVLTRWLDDHMEHVTRSLVNTPMGRAATPDDIADAVYFLALGTDLMTGQVVVVDGGRTM
ncbi:MAG: SDR family oxidoreductase [Planctomycetes bacterium]|jgi:3-oxoacyl-[acyl-carrier protein] reductase|nr:SDR family oxidoreductase [Planctomycetota bacterium]